MQIHRVILNNILGIEHLEVEAGKFVQIAGANGQGKTSVLEGIKAALKGGHDATLLRAGAEKGEAVLILDDGTEIAKRVTAGKSTLSVIDGNGRKSTSPAETVKALTDMLSINPVDFLLAPKKERVNTLLESMPLKVNPETIEQVVAPIKVQVPSGHALVAIEAVRKLIYDDRTGTNRALKEKGATINQLRSTLPAAIEVPGGADGIAARLAELDAAKDAELGRIGAKLDGLRKASGEKVAAIKADAEARIADIRAECAAAVEAEQAALREVEAKAAAARERTLAKHTQDSGDLRAQLGAIETAQRQHAAAEATRKTVETMTADAERLEAEAKSQTAALDALDAYKNQLLAALPIPGLTVVDGEIMRDGVPFDRLNTAQQVAIAVEIAKLRAGKIGVICVDRLECLDGERFEEFRKQALASGLQMFVTRVSDGELTITTQNQ